MTTPNPRGYPRHSGIGDVMPTEPDRQHWNWDGAYARRFAAVKRAGTQTVKQATARAALLLEE